MISSRFFHALGYHVPDTSLVRFHRDQLVVETNATDITSNADVRPLLPGNIDRLLADVARRSDGRYRAVALRVPTDGVSLVGPFQLFGTRNDDPNDIVPHEHRRELRGLQVFSAWLNHTRMDALHTVDIVVQPEGQPPHIRHYLFDFSATLGSAITGAKPVWEGRDPIYGQATALRNIAGLGVYTPGWMRAKYPGLPAVGGLRFQDVRAGEVDQPVRRGAVRQPTAGRRVLGGSTGGRLHGRGHPRHRAGCAVFRSEGRALDCGLPD